MRDMDILNLIESLKTKPQEYIDSINRQYESFLDYSELPNVCRGFNDINILPPKLKKLYTNITVAISGRYNFLFCFGNLNNIDYLCSLFLNKYFIDSIEHDNILEHVLYIDTKLLIEDYKRLMNYNKNEDYLPPVHSLDTLFHRIENAPVIFWDKFSRIDSSYDKDKLLDIITIRNRKGLSNFYFVEGKSSELGSKLGITLCDLISQHMDVGYDCFNYNIKINHTKEADLFIC